MGRRVIPLILALLTLVGLSAGYRATLTSVTLVIDGVSHAVRTHQPTVSLLLADLAMSLRPEDHVKPGLDAALAQGMVVEVQRARPVVLVVDGRERIVYAHGEQPVDLLAEHGVVLSRYDAFQIRSPLVTDPPDTRHRIVVQRAARVILDQGATRTSFYTTAPTIGEALLEAGIRLYRADKVFPDLATPVFDGMHVQVQLSAPVSVRIDGHVMRTRTHRARVGEVLADLGMTLNGLDYAVPPLDASLGDGLEIQVVRVTESVIVEQSSIPFDVVWQPDPNTEIDTQGLLQEGKPGVLERRIRLRYEDGRVVDRWVEGESIVLPPSNRVMGYGTKVVVRQLSTSSGPVEYWRVLKCLATSYSASTSGVSRSNPSYGRTATGKKMRHGIVAVDPNVIPLGTRVYVPGYGVGLAADTGGAIWGKRIDLGYDDDNLELWYAWVDVYLLTPVPSNINYSGP
jgi:resuscitation-promoting factor RpfB